MSKRFSRAIPATARAAFISGLLLSVAGCSSEVSRLSQPFFSNDDTTGSLVPPEPVYGVGLAANSSSDNSQYRPVSRGAISSAPLAPAPGTISSSGPISTRSTQPVQQASYNPPSAPQPSYTPAVPERQATYAPQPSYGQQRGYAQPALEPRRKAETQSRTVQQGSASANQVHKVASGDTVYSIARTYDVPVSQVIAENNLDAPDRIRVGQRLVIPGGSYAERSQPVRVAASNHIQTDAAPQPVARPVPNEPALTRRVVTATDAGQQPYGAPQPRRVATQPIQGQPLDNSTLSPAPQPPQFSEQAAPQREQRTALLAPSRPPVPAQQSEELAEPDSLSGGKFRWPARGRIISQFGSKPNGVQNDGINIAVPEGTSIKAAEAGVVAYVGNELKGFGNLVLVRHADDWVTAYAHNSDVLVRRGDTVQRGQIIAKAGRTGNVDQPQLHFEIRKGSKPQNPLQQLPSI